MQTTACAYASRTQNIPIKVVHIISDLSIGGAEMMLYKLLRETDRSSFEPVVISLINRGPLRARIEALGIPVHTVNIKSAASSPAGFWRLVWLLRRIRPDLIVGWMYHSCLAAQLASFFLRRRTRVFWSIHFAIYSHTSTKRTTAAIIRACAPLSKLASRIIFVSHASRDQHTAIGYSVANSCVIPNGINTSEFIPSRKSRAAVRSELGVAKDALLIGMMGRYHPVKDHANFLQAAHLVSQRNPNVNFVLIGQGVDHQNKELCRLIRDLGLTRQTHLLGERDDMPRISASLDVFSLSSHCESFPNVIGEAMACEVPCAVTNVGDASFLVGGTGRVVESRNPRALANAWQELIELGTVGRSELGRAARSRIIEHFRLDSVVRRYEALYGIAVPEEHKDFALTRPALASVED